MTNDWHIPLIVFAFMACDIISGLIKGWSMRNISSTKLRQGLANKSSFTVMLVLAYLCEYAMGYIDLGFVVPLVPAVAVYICLTEVVSVCENVAEINPELKDSPLFGLFDTDRDDKDA